MGSLDQYYSSSAPYSPYEHGPPPSRSAYANIRPGLSVLTAPSVYSAPGMSQALQPSIYDPSRMALRAQTDTSAIPAYSARRPVQLYHDQPSPYDPSPVSAPEPPSPERSHHSRKPVSARRPANPPAYEEHEFYDDDSGSESGSSDDDDDAPPAYAPIRRNPSQRGERMVQARGGPYPGSYGTSPQDYMHANPYDYYGADAMSDYRSSVRSKTTNGSGSSRSRRPSVSSSGAGTKATSYSASSGSGRRQSMYADSVDPAVEAELYIRNKDRQAQYVRTQQPPLTQESLRQQARQIEGKRNSRVGGVSIASSKQSSSYRSQSRTITCADEQAVKIQLNTSAGIDLQLEGDTEGRPIRLVQQPGDSFAQLVIGTGTGAGRKTETVYNSGSGSSGRTRQSGERDSSKLSRESERTSRSSKAAVSGRRERARTMVER